MDQQVLQLHLSISLTASLITDELTNCGAVFNDWPAPPALVVTCFCFFLFPSFFNPKIILPLLINSGKLKISGILTRLSMCGCYSQAFGLAWGGLLRYVWQMVSWHVLACLVSENASSGALLCFCHVCSNTSDRWSSDMLWQIWVPKMLQVAHCHVYVLFTQTLLPCELLTCFGMFVVRKYSGRPTDMFVACFLKHLWQVLGRTRQDHAKFQKTSMSGLRVLNCHGGDHSK